MLIISSGVNRHLASGWTDTRTGFSRFAVLWPRRLAAPRPGSNQRDQTSA